MILKFHLLTVLLVALDFIFKKLAVAYLKGNETIVLIKGLLGLTYVENRGAAFGIFSGKQLMLILLSVAIIVILEYYLFKYKPQGLLVNLTVSLIVAGGIGNLIDRVVQGFVVDFIDINQLFSFPMFNFADICVTVGEFLLLVLILKSEIKERKLKNAKKDEDKEEEK